MIGEKEKNLTFLLEPLEYCTFILNNFINDRNSSFDEKSSSFYYNTKFNIKYHGIENCYFCTEKIKLNIYNTINKSTQSHTLNLSNFIFTNSNSNSNIFRNRDKVNSKSNFGGIIGFTLSSGVYENCPTFIENLNKQISNFSYSWHIEYFAGNKIYDGQIVVGTEPHIYNKNSFSKKYFLEFYTDNAYSENVGQQYAINFNEIYFVNEGKKILDDKINSEATLLFNLQMIQSSKIFFDKITKYFFSDFLEGGICKMILFLNRYNTISCEKSLIKNKAEFIKRHPNIYFYHKNANYTFEINSNFLFHDFEDKLLYNIYYDSFYSLNWKLGRIFLEKYTINFNYDKKTIGFYTKKEEKFNKKKVIYFILVVFFVLFLFGIVGFFGFLLGKKLYENHRKRHANELKDYYEYSDVINEKKGKEKNIETQMRLFENGANLM